MLSGGGGEICTVLVACMTKKTVLGNNEKIDFVNEDFVSLYSPLRIEYSFFNEHKEVFAKLYDTLGDEKSKQCMNAFLNQRISGKFEYLDHMWLENQYFDKELINLKNISCIVDCGAYDGDTFRAFCENYKADSGKSYEGKAILLEPAKNNYEKLVNNFSSKENIVILQLGAWNEKTVLCFEENVYEPTACRFSEEGEMSVLVDKIDNIVLPQDKVDFIKMDIEGSELNALRGAENAIRKDKPLLAICVYHKKEDLITIPQYIKSLYSGYRLYLRSYEKYCRELVLYAIPD